jgi:hypothetical protein
MAISQVLNDLEKAKTFLRDDKTDMLKKDLAAKYGIDIADVSKIRARLTKPTAQAKKPAAKKASKPKPAVNGRAPISEAIYILEQKRDELDKLIAGLKQV